MKREVDYRHGRKPDKHGSFQSEEGRRVLAHRYAYERFVGPIPSWAVIDHLCSNRWCVNPYHLEAVTMVENTRRALAYVVPRYRSRHRKFDMVQAANAIAGFYRVWWEATVTA